MKKMEGIMIKKHFLLGRNSVRCLKSYLRQFTPDHDENYHPDANITRLLCLKLIVLFIFLSTP